MIEDMFRYNIKADTRFLKDELQKAEVRLAQHSREMVDRMMREMLFGTEEKTKQQWPAQIVDFCLRNKGKHLTVLVPRPTPESWRIVYPLLRNEVEKIYGPSNFPKMIGRPDMRTVELWDNEIRIVSSFCPNSIRGRKVDKAWYLAHLDEALEFLQNALPRESDDELVRIPG